MIFIFICAMFMIYVILFFSRVSVFFLSRAKVHECIETNHEFYVRFSDADFSARRVKTIEEYLAKIKPTMSCFSLSEKLKILYCIHYHQPWCLCYRWRS